MDKLVISKVLNRSDCGWHEVFLEDNTSILLCYSTSLIKEAQFLRVLEGPYKGRLIKIADQSILDKYNHKINVKSCLYYQDRHIFILPNSETFKTIPQRNFIPKGEYFIGIPTYPNLRLTKKEYIDESKKGSRFATTWFPISDKNKNPTPYFLHLGKISDGCVTIAFPQHTEDWNKIFLFLLSHRTNDGYLINLKVK